MLQIGDQERGQFRNPQHRVTSQGNQRGIPQPGQACATIGGYSYGGIGGLPVDSGHLPPAPALAVAADGPERDRSQRTHRGRGIDQAGAEHGGGYGQGDGVRGLSCTVQVLWTYSARLESSSCRSFSHSSSLDNAPWYARRVFPVMAFSMSFRVCGLTMTRCPEATADAAVIFGVVWFIGV